MLYIASALTPTPVLDSLSVTGLTAPGQTSLVVAKSDKVEVWDVDEYGLTYNAEIALWGQVTSISQVTLPDAKPHLLVLLGPPNAHLLLLAHQDRRSPKLIVTASLPLTPPTPSLRQAEFFTGIIAQGSTALISLWVGVLSCIVIDVEKDKDAKKRRSSAAGDLNLEHEDATKRLIFSDNFNINIREHNLLHLAFMPSPTPEKVEIEPTVSFLWLSSSSTLQLQARKLSLTTHSFNELSQEIDIVTPLRQISVDANTDFNDVPLSCPAARRILPASPSQFMVIGDEHTVLYNLAQPVAKSPSARKASLSSSTAPLTSPRASAIRRSPQDEMFSKTGKRRKSSITERKTSIGSGSASQWELKPVWRVRQGFGTVLAASILESHSLGGTALIGDECGRLTAMRWQFDQAASGSRYQGSVQVSKISLGTASPPSSFTSLSSSHIFLGSACGDSSLLQLSVPTESRGESSSMSPSRPIPARKGKARASGGHDEGEWDVTYLDGPTGSTTTRERWMNMAPLRDFDVVREEGGGVSHLVVSSGASNSNSLRIVRSGASLEEVLTLEGIKDITGMWPLRSADGQSSLLCSTLQSTILLSVGLQVEVQGCSEDITSQSTVFASSLPNGSSWIHITPQAVNLRSSSSSLDLLASWKPDEGGGILTASISNDLVVVAARKGVVQVLQAAAQELQEIVSCQIGTEISTVEIISHPNLPSPVIAVATWTKEILLYTFDHLRLASTVVTAIKEEFHASTLLLRPSASSSTSSSGIQLLAGLSNGTMITYDLEPSGDQEAVAMKGKRASSLGTRPLDLCPVSGVDSGEDEIVAIGLTERMSVIFKSRDRIDFSAASKKDVVTATSINIPDMGECLVLATPAEITLVGVNSLKKLSVQTYDTGTRSASKVTSLQSQNVFAIGSVSREMDSETGDVVQTAYLELRHPVSLYLLAEMKLEAREEAMCVSEVFLMGRYYVVVGTAIYPDDDDIDELSLGSISPVQAKSGRILLINPAFEPKKETWGINVTHTQDVAGPVYDVKVIHGFLAVAAGSTVSINRVSPSRSEFEELSQFSSAFIASQLYVEPHSKLDQQERLIVGDGMRSIFVLEVDEESGMIYSDQRDMATHQVTALEGIKDRGDGVVIADGYSNLLTFRLGEGIENGASFGLHEDVTRFRHGSLAPSSSAPETMLPDLLFATADGRIGIIGELTSNASLIMDELQRNMARYYKGPGGIEWRTWRRGGTQVVQKETAGFVDGDFIQQFTNIDLISAAEGEKIMKGSNVHEAVHKTTGAGKDKEIADRADVIRTLEGAAGLH